MYNVSMSLTTEQTPKTYNEKQDHGTAAGRKGHEPISYWDKKYDDRGIDKQDDEIFKDAVAELNLDYESMSNAELEAEADAILDPLNQYTTTSERFIPSTEKAANPYETGEDEDEIDYEGDRFLTEAEVEQLSKHQIRVRMGQRATLDYDFESEDDNGDDNPQSHIRIKNRL